MTTPLQPAEIETLLAELQAGPASEGSKALVQLDPPSVLWVSPDAIRMLGTADRFALARLVFGRFNDTRPVTTRLDRLKPGGPASLEAVQVRSRFSSSVVVFRCRAVPDRAPKTVLFEAVSAALPREPLPDDNAETEVFEPSREAPSAPLVVPVEARHQPALRMAPDISDGRQAASRFVWRTDGTGLITQIGPEMQIALGRSALQVGDNLENRLHALGGAAVEAADAMAARRSWNARHLDWPVEENGSMLQVDLGGTPSPDGLGFRGFGVVRSEARNSGTAFEPASAVEPAALEAEASRQAPDDPASGLIADLADVIPGEPRPSMLAEAEPPQASVMGGPELPPLDMFDIAEAIEPLRTDLDREVPPGAPMASRFGEPSREMAVLERPERDAPPVPATPANVVQLAAFKPGGLPMTSARAVRRDAPGPTAEAANLPDAPRWAEMPAQNAPGETPDQKLSTHERFNFDEIARALAALPTAEASPSLTDSPGADPRGRAVPGRPDDSWQARAARAGLANTTAVLDGLPLGLLVSQGDQVVYANRALLDLTGYDSLDDLEQAGGLGSLVGTRPPSTGSHEEHHTTVLRTKGGARVSVEARIRTISWADLPAALWSVRVGSDTHHGGARDTALEQPADRPTALDLAEALDLAASGVGCLDQEGRIAAVTGSAERLFGSPGHDLVGTNCLQLIALSHQAQWTAFFKEFAATSLRRRASAFHRSAIRKHDGEEVPVGISLRRIGPDRICVVWQRSVHGHATASELDLLRRDAERASALKSEFLAKISHEIRTPLNAMLGFTEMIIEERFGPVGNDRYREYLKDIHASGTHVVSLVNDLLDLSRIESGAQDVDLRPVNVNAVIGDCVSTLQAQAFRDRIILRSSLAARTPLAIADERSFRQIVLNLLSNAVKFNEPGGQVIVSSAITESDRVVIRVRDTGLGMSDSEIELAMKPFRQLATAKASVGTGLGLPLTKAMIEACHGSFRIESKPGEGTLVEVTFPRAVDAVSLPAE